MFSMSVVLAVLKCPLLFGANRSSAPVASIFQQCLFALPPPASRKKEKTAPIRAPAFVFLLKSPLVTRYTLHRTEQNNYILDYTLDTLYTHYAHYTRSSPPDCPMYVLRTDTLPFHTSSLVFMPLIWLRVMVLG